MLFINSSVGIHEGEIVAEFHVPNTPKESTVEEPKYVFEVVDAEYPMCTESLILTYPEAVARREWAFDFYTYDIEVHITPACPTCGYKTHTWEDGLRICLNHPECNWSNEHEITPTKEDYTLTR